MRTLRQRIVDAFQQIGHDPPTARKYGRKALADVLEHDGPGQRHFQTRRGIVAVENTGHMVPVLYGCGVSPDYIVEVAKVFEDVEPEHVPGILERARKWFGAIIMGAAVIVLAAPYLYPSQSFSVRHTATSCVVFQRVRRIPCISGRAADKARVFHRDRTRTRARVRLLYSRKSNAVRLKMERLYFRRPVYFTETERVHFRGPVYFTETDPVYFRDPLYFTETGLLNSRDPVYFTGIGPVYFRDPVYFTETGLLNSRDPVYFTGIGPTYFTAPVYFTETGPVYFTGPPIT